MNAQLSVRLLRLFLGDLEGVEGLTGAVSRWLGLLQSALDARSAAVLCEMQPIAVSSPDARDWLDGLELAGGDRKLQKACAKPRWELGGAPAPGNEKHWLCFPLGQRLLVYLGWESEPPAEMEELDLFVDLGARLLLELDAREHAQRETELERQRAARLEGWIGELGQLLAHLPQLTSLTHVTEHLEAILPQLIEHDARIIWPSPDEPPRTHGGTFHKRVLKELTEFLTSQNRPLALDELDRSRFRGLVEGPQALLAAPSGSGGWLVLLGARFDRSALGLLELLARQAGVARENARLHTELHDAYRKLTESEQQLMQSSKLAAVGQLAAGVAHEINNPLASIQLALEAALRAPHKPEMFSPLLENARQAVQRLQAITNKLLYYSREGRQGKQKADLNELVQDGVLLFGLQVPLTLDLYDKKLLTLCNLDEVQQVLLNLLLNAREAPNVQVKTGETKDHVFLEVWDDGPGVDQAIRDKIFDPFFTTRPVGQGTGLGLSVSQQIARGHDGKLELMPTDRGACFRLSLPRATPTSLSF